MRENSSTDVVTSACAIFSVLAMGFFIGIAFMYLLFFLNNAGFAVAKEDFDRCAEICEPHGGVAEMKLQQCHCASPKLEIRLPREESEK